MFRVLCRAAVALALLFCASFIALAQSSTDGAIAGVVRDPQEAVVPGASVTVRNEDTNQTQTATTDDEGRFRVVQLDPGNYTVTIAAGSFAQFTQANVVVEVGRVTSLNDIRLGITAGAEQVEVTAEAPVINVAQQDFSTNINQVSLNNLPINGRRASDFVRLTPGVVPDGDFGLNSFRGISGLLNNNTVDGGDNNNAFFAEERGRTRISYVVSQDSVREFQVNTSNYSAEFGRAAGGVVNTVTKSGTNEFHGSLFYFIRDNELGARNPFSFQNVLRNGVIERVALKPDDRRQQFGGTLGGPVVKDRLFFFFTYDQQKRNFPGVGAFRQANFLNFTSTNPQAETLRAGLASLSGEVPRRADQYIIFPKLDYQINDANTLTISYNRLRFDAPAGVESPPVVEQGIGSFGDDFVDVDTFIPRLTSTINATTINEFRFQYSRELLTQFQDELTPFENQLAQRATVRTPSGFLPQVDLRTPGGIRFGFREFLNRNALPDERRLQFFDTLTLTRGNHTIKFGADVSRIEDKVDNLRFGNGGYAYNNLAGFITDASGVGTNVGRNYQNFQQAFGLSAFDFVTDDLNFFVQDDYRYSPRLTLNLGLRYEYQTLPDPQVPNTLSNLAGQFIGPEQTRSFATDKNNFGPRVGFAYDLTGDGKTSLRGGYGIYYGRIINSTISNAITNTGAPGSQLIFFFSSPTAAGAPVFPNVLAAPPSPVNGVFSPGPDIVALSPNLRNPLIHQGDIVFEREIARNTIVSVSYLASVGRRLPRFVDRNLSAPTQTRTFTVSGGEFNGQTFTSPVFTGARPDTRFGRITEVQSSVRSEYNALVLQFNRRLTDGLQFQVNYTFSDANDTGQESVTFTSGNNVLNPFDLNLQEGRSDFDIPHRFVASAVWTPGLPFGLEENALGRAIFGGFVIAPIVQIASGEPVSGSTSGNLSGGTAGGILGAGGTSRPFFIERNTFRQPYTANFDLRVSRRFNFTETANFEIIGEVFNVFNRTNITNVNTQLFNVGGTAAAQTLTFNPTFLTPTAAGNTVFRERQIQLAARFQF